MKVLHVLNHSLPHIDGYSQRSHCIVRNQRLIGIEIAVLTSPKHEYSEGEIDIFDGIKYYRTGKASAGRLSSSVPYLKEWCLMRQLRDRIGQIAKKEKVDLIHAHSPSLNGFPAQTIGRKLGIPVVYELRALWEDAAVTTGNSRRNSPRYFISRSLETKLLKEVDGITTICEGLKHEISQRGVPSGKVHVCANGVDTEYFAPNPDTGKKLREQFRLESHFIVGFIGSFYHWEGLDLLLQAITSINPHHNRVHILLVGSGEQENNLRELVTSLNLRDKVTFAGKVPPDQIRSYYSIIDLCIYPRRKMRLTDLVTPLKPLEAMAMGKMVLASDVGGHRELIRDGVDGLLFRADDSLDLATKIQQFAQGDFSSLNLCENARARVVAERNWKGIVSGYLNLYQQLLSEKT